MKLTGNPKNQIEMAGLNNEKKNPIDSAGMKLTDKELDMVSGGGEPIPLVKAEDKDR